MIGDLAATYTRKGTKSEPRENENIYRAYDKPRNVCWVIFLTLNFCATSGGFNLKYEPSDAKIDRLKVSILYTFHEAPPQSNLAQ